MKKWMFPASLVLMIAIAALAYAFPRSSSAAVQNCDDWGNDTLDRIAIARQLLYPRERQEQSTGSLQGDAQALYDVAQEQANTDGPDEAFNLNGDLVEAFSAGATALGSNSSSSEAQIAFAKGIIYNADLCVAYLLDGC
ncbi:MAG: hypothetical protein H0W23_08655 [Chloroflexia bacterium]|nr:hypothetical protein [Chloroflexia bacterium]